MFELREGDKGVDLSKCKNLEVSIVKENSLAANSRTENVTINGSRIALQINAKDNNKVGVFRVSVAYDVENADSETGFIHVIRDIPNAFEIIPLSTEETQAMVFVVSSQGGFKPTGMRDGKDGKDGKDGRIALVNHGTSDTTFALTPNIMHVWGEVEHLNLSLAPNTEPTILAEHCFQFSSPANKAMEFQLQGVEWYEGVVPTILKGRTYQGSVVNGVAILISN